MSEDEIKKSGIPEDERISKKRKSKYHAFNADVPALDPATIENLIFSGIVAPVVIDNEHLTSSVQVMAAANDSVKEVAAPLEAHTAEIVSEDQGEIPINQNRLALEDFMKRFDLPDGKPMNIALNSLVHEEYKSVAIENQTTITSLVNTVLHHWLIEYSAEIKAVRRLRGKKKGII